MVTYPSISLPLYFLSPFPSLPFHSHPTCPLSLLVPLYGYTDVPGLNTHNTAGADLARRTSSNLAADEVAFYTKITAFA